MGERSISEEIGEELEELKVTNADSDLLPMVRMGRGFEAHIIDYSPAFFDEFVVGVGPVSEEHLQSYLSAVRTEIYLAEQALWDYFGRRDSNRKDAVGERAA